VDGQAAAVRETDQQKHRKGGDAIQGNPSPAAFALLHTERGSEPVDPEDDPGDRNSRLECVHIVRPALGGSSFSPSDKPQARCVIVAREPRRPQTRTGKMQIGSQRASRALEAVTAPVLRRCSRCRRRTGSQPRTWKDPETVGVRSGQAKAVGSAKAPAGVGADDDELDPAALADARNAPRRQRGEQQ
jgi:hypothetical protein